MRALLAVDLLDDAPEDQAQTGTRWAERFGATLDLLFVSPPLDTGWVMDPAAQAMLEKETQVIQATQTERLNELLAQVPHKLRGEAHLVRSTRPGDEIAELASNYDIVLLHTHGRTGLKHLFLGSVAERVVRLAKVPVLVLRS